MEHDPNSRALSAANLALAGRRSDRPASSRFASIELRELMRGPRVNRGEIAWEAAAVLSVAVAAVLFVTGVWFL